MHGLMQDWQLTLDRVIEHAATQHGNREVVARRQHGQVARATYYRIRDRAHEVSQSLVALGIGRGDRVGTLAWNDDRHLECWYGIMGIGAICHTLNPRLHPTQLSWIVRHAQDRIIIVDAGLAGLLGRALAEAPHTVERVILLGDHSPQSADFGVVVTPYEDWLREASVIDGAISWGGFSEETASGLCYTSGTTGDPKGVLYSHRSNFLHTLSVIQPDMLGLSATDTVLPIVPMFHANAWGLAFASPAVGAKLVLPGSQLDGASLFELLEEEQVTFAAAVPTVWQTMLEFFQRAGVRPRTLRRAMIGGAACPESLVASLQDKYGIEVRHAWGMTELSPLGTVNAPDEVTASLTAAERRREQCRQGRAAIGFEMTLQDEAGERVAKDGVTPGRLLVRGPAVARAYFDGDFSALDTQGWFDTGDIATIDARGYMKITDRAKDIIKSGGEWISSVELENIAAGHPNVALAAVVAIPDPKWDERPALIVQMREGAAFSASRILAELESKVPRWWLPEHVMRIDTMPLGATGKIDKKVLREWLARPEHGLINSPSE